MDALVNKKYTITIPLMEGDEYFALTDEDTASYSLYDLSGNIVNELEDVNIELTDDNRTMLKIEIPAEANTITESNDSENRVLVVSYTYQNVQHSARRNYRIIPFVPYVTTEDDVRTLLGVPSTNVLDSMIDIYQAYLKAKASFVSATDETTKEIFDNALKSGGTKAGAANRIIAIRAALPLRTSLPLLIPKIEDESVMSQTRFTMSLEDFNALFDALEDELSELEGIITEEDITDTYVPDLFVVGERTDLFTGE